MHNAKRNRLFSQFLDVCSSKCNSYLSACFDGIIAAKKTKLPKANAAEGNSFHHIMSGMETREVLAPFNSTGKEEGWEIEPEFIRQ